MPAALAAAALAGMARAAEYEFSRALVEDRYDRAMERPGNPKIIRDLTSPGLLTETEMGVYAAKGPEPVAVAAGEFALPEGGKVRFGHGVRIYGFGGCGGTLRTSLAGKAGPLAFAVSGRPGEDPLRCRVEGPGLKPLAFEIPKKSLPADFTFIFDDRGAFEWTVSGLADASRVVKTGRSAVFDGFWVGGYGYPPFRLETAFARDGDGEATVTLDNLILGECTPVEKIDVPAKIEPAPEFDPVKAGWPLVFADEFDGDRVDWSKWYHRPKAGNPDRDDFCRPDGKGVLRLKCDYGPDGTNLITSSLRSKREFTYGYFESRFRLTRQNGWWAAFWMYGRLNSDPFVDGIEIDIFEDYYTRKRDPQGLNRRQLDHNLHLYLGSQLKSWNFSHDYEGSIDDWIVLGCKRTPFEISYYLNGKLVSSCANHCNWPSVTFDAFSHAATTVPLHVILSGQVMGRSWPWFDKTGAKFPECFQVDYVRCYEMPRPAAKLPRIAWAGEAAKDDGALRFFSKGERMRFDVTAAPAADGGAKLKAVYLFDAGGLIGYRTEPPFSFDVEMTPEWYAKTRYMKPGRQNVVPDFNRAPHSFVAFVQDEAGNVAHTEPIRRHPCVFNPATRPYGGEPQKLPGRLAFWRYDEGGPGVAYFDTSKGNLYAKSGKRPEGDVDCTGGELASVMPGEWVNYTVEVERDALYRADLHYGTGQPAHHRLHLAVDGKLSATFNLDFFGDREAWGGENFSAAVDGIRLAKGRHVLTLYSEGQFNLGRLTFTPCAVRVSDFGFDREDSTRFIQAALDSGAARIVFDRRTEGPWVSDRLRGRSNCEIVFEDGAELVARRGAFQGPGDALLTFSCASNVTIRGKGRLRMWKDDYQKPPYRKSEWRHALSLLACRNVTVEDMEFVESGGDGIYISVVGKPAPGFRTCCENVTVRNVKCLRNHRQGISVIAVDGLLVENCDLSDTLGTAPESGIDFEPNVPQDPIANCVVRNCRLERNHGHGVEIMLVTHDELTAPVSIAVEGCAVRDNAGTPFCYNGIAPNGGFRTPSGRISVTDCTVRKGGGTNEAYSATVEWSGAKGLPPTVYPDAWDPSKAKVVDRAPGQLVKLLPTRCRRNAAYLLYAAKPGTVRLAAKQMVVGKGKPSVLPLVVSRFRGGKVTELEAPSEKGTSYSFEVPARGFYQVDWARGMKEWGTSLVLTESDVPIAFSMFTDRNARGLWMAPFMYGLADVKMHFAVPEGCPGFAATACGFAGGLGQHVRAVVRDPSGKVVYDCDNVGFTDVYRSGARPPAGLWTIESHRPSNGKINNFGFDLAGLPPVFFLSADKYWVN